MKKQIVFVMTDTTRKDMLGCYGNKKMHTPNLDRLAAEGIRFENAYTAQPVCGPSRSAIFTGTFPHTNGMVTNCIAMGDNVKTIGQRLSDNGIHCGYIGKWHLDGSDYFGNGRCPEGWDEEYWYDMRRYLDELPAKDRVRSRSSDTAFDEDMTADFTYAHRCSNRAVDFIDKYKDEDFLLVVSYDEPHGPCLCPPPYNSMYQGFRFDDNPNYEDDLTNKPLMQRLWAGDAIKSSADEINKPSRQLSLFLGCNSFVDHEIGRVLDKVREELPDAMVIYTSDHGDMLGNHKLQMKNAAAYKEIANVPLIIKGGEKGKVVEAVSSHIDLAPTILEYMGVAVPECLEGRSILSQIYDTDKEINDVVFTEFTRYEVDHDGFGGLQMMRAAISKRFKLVIHLLDTDEFYDMEKDPYEVNNLINDESYARERDKLHDALLEHMNDTRDLYRGYQWSCRTWRKDKNPLWANDGYTRQRLNEEYEPRQLDYDTGLEMTEAVRKKTTKDEKN
ncbi:sulfatase-like hydrolase/transferase [Butyrivibrio sp. MC2013]|uniref:sulfatase-like hydrolase/transferase n=1 Tax=Butyrivibrio sp. MC2013 TaxID=1280686 RepID=UPI0004038B7E|nr:sulfatase-like hydrolase/transferase [Butyrivibrio sp. MC2013]